MLETVVAVVDISRPESPKIIGHTPPVGGGQQFERHKAVRIGRRDVLVAFFFAPPVPGPGYLKLFDISNPTQPIEIGSYALPVSGFHFEVARQGSRVLALLSAVRSEAHTSNYGASPGTGDLVIVDISDPANPAQVGEWGVIDDPALGLAFYLTHQQGAQSRDYGEGLSVSADGRYAYYAYSDFGVMILDISNPASPRLIGRVGYDPEDNGDAHQVKVAQGGKILVRSSIVRWPFQTRVTSGVLEGVRSAAEDLNTPDLYSLSGHKLEGTISPVVGGCDAADYTSALAGKVALIQNTTCGTWSGGNLNAWKVIQAQATGAAAVILYGPVRPPGYDDGHGTPNTQGRLRLNDGALVPITIPVVMVGWKTGSCLAQTQDESGSLVTGCNAASGVVTVRLESFWTGYGRLEVFDIGDPWAPVKLSTIGTEHSMDIDYALSFRYPAPNPSMDVTASHFDIVGSTIYAGFWADGLRVIDISQPAAPRVIGAWRGEGSDPGDAPLRGWEVVWHNSLIVLNSPYHGLYILK